MNEKPPTQIIRAHSPFDKIQVWQKLVVGLRSENRFTLAEESAQFVEQLIQYASQHKTVSLPSDRVLFRARIHATNEEHPFSLDRMGAPPAYLAGHGRLNPKGIPYLYLASDKITAISEVRPWVGCDLTVAEFHVVDECRLINFSKRQQTNDLTGENFEASEFTWRELISWLFSAPFDPRDDTAYIPTQYLAERIKGAGFSGIMYDSALNDGGYNVALFDVSKAKATRREKAQVTATKIDARFDEVSDGQG